MKKVLLVATVQSHICQFHHPLVSMLHQHGVEVHAAARNNLAEKNGLSIGFIDRVFDIPFNRSPFSPANLKAYRMLKKLIDEGDYDVIHCNTPVGGVVGRLAARAARRQGARVFYTAHGFHFYKGAPVINWLLYYPLEKLIARLTDKLITITEEDCRLAKRKFRTEVCHTHGVGVDAERFRLLPAQQAATLRSELGFGEEHFLLLCVGELLKNKNQATLIRAVAILKDSIPGIRLLLAGNGPMRDDLESLVKELELESNIVFTGYRPDIERYTNACDIVVSASFREGLPLNILEAMRCGKPVVASGNRGHNELVKDGRTGFLVDAGDAAAFAEKTLLLYQDDALRRTLSARAIECAEAYTSGRVMQELEAIYYG